MKECCATCRHRLDLEKYDYENGGCEHTSMEGYACTALAYEGTVVWMVGLREDGMCEEYKPREGD